jgi:transcriptional regulator with XRE-family HTH domain
MSERGPVDAEIARLAQRVRRWREEAGYTLQELADRSDVATSTIQKVESFQMVPSVAVLLKIARGLGRSPSELVSEAPAEHSVVHLQASERHAVGNRRRMLVERLSGDLADAAVEMWRITVQPGYGSGRGTIAYSGEELVLGEQGELSFRIGEEEYRLRAGDVLHFKARAPHSWRNEGRSVARFLILGTLSPALREALHRRISGRANKAAGGGA